MTDLICRYWTPILSARLLESRPLIQIVLGPRQVGKTTSLTQLAATWNDSRLVSKSADDAQTASSWEQKLTATLATNIIKINVGPGTTKYRQAWFEAETP